MNSGGSTPEAKGAGSLPFMLFGLLTLKSVSRHNGEQSI